MERPILFSTSMVRAVLDGRKSQTRRIVKPPYQSYPCVTKHLSSNEFDFHYDKGIGQFTACPYGNEGLWVRETFYAYGHWTRILTHGLNSVKKEHHFHDLTLSENKKYLYEDCPPEVILKRWGLGYHKRPSIFMPKEACRIKLEITDLKVERLHAILDPSRENDAKAEGVSLGYEDNDFGVFSSYRKGFKDIWIKINGKDSWSQNPWVWVIKFKKL